MVYDIILGRTMPTKYNYNYIRSMYTNRIDVEEINNYHDLIGLIMTSINEAFKHVGITDEAIETVSSKFAILYDNTKQNPNLENVEIEIRELLSTIAFRGYDLYIIRRPDLQAAVDMPVKTRAYMIDKHDAYFPELNRVTTGTSLIFDDTADANIATVIMQFLKNVRFDDVVEDLIDLDKFRENYEVLEGSHVGYSMNVDALVEFLDDYGYKFVVVVE